MTITTAVRLPEFTFNSDAQALTALDRNHKYIINLGGKGSGKTATHRVWAADRAAWDTGSLHGIFTNTDKQLKGPVFEELFAAFPIRTASDYGKRPPKAWIREWARHDTPVPPGIVDYRHIWYTRSGLHVMCGTLHNQSYKQYESFQFSTLRIEEIPALSTVALSTILSRLRCGKGENCEAEYGHRHQVWMFGNPPVGPHPWLTDWLDTMEENAKTLLYHEDESCPGCYFVTPSGRQIAKTHGPSLNHRQWPLLRRGIGNTILIQSKTSENRANLNAGYEDDIAMNSDRATARAWLEGEFSREVGGGCYDAFSADNVRSVDYDPNRTLLVGLDMNIEPRVAVLAHPLRDGEFPSEWGKPGIEQIGVFGEFFSLAGGLSDQQFAEAIVRGDRGAGDAGYADEILRGLPANWQGLRAHNGPIVFYGDAVGHTRSVHSANLESSWQILDAVFREVRDPNGRSRYSRDVPSSNPPARARIHSLNAKLRSNMNIPSLSVDPRCRQLIKDFERVVWDENGAAEREWRRGSGGTEFHRTHLSSALGYMIWRRCPMGRALAESTIDLSTMGGTDLEQPWMR